MRIRNIKPSFWVDKTIASLPWRTRLVYIGLWQLCDDSGIARWDVAQVGAELMPFEAVKRREAWLEADLAALVDRGRVVLLDCGRHVEVPTLVEHQRFGGRPVYTEQIAHARDCARLRADAPTGREGKGREGKVARADARGKTNGFESVREAAAAAGITK